MKVSQIKIQIWITLEIKSCKNNDRYSLVWKILKVDPKELIKILFIYHKIRKIKIKKLKKKIEMQLKKQKYLGIISSRSRF